ncbi:hypothetical protein CH359_11635 [Leptospira meyeri]|nr:hypothetical protein CH359_11635 [Leptospira meyeri]PJZ95810.1 hypothetical protein CH358_15820 [Leptospira meyeri]
MKNMKLIIIPMVGLFLTLISVYNCGADEKQSSQLLPLLALGLLADGNLEGQVCDIDSDCASGLFCGDAYNLDTPYTYNLCTAIPPISGTITGNGTGLSATLATFTPVADFSLTINTPGKYVFSASSEIINASVVRPEISIYPASGRSAIKQATRNPGSNYQLTSYIFSDPGTYRVRVSTFYFSGSFGGGVRFFAANGAVSSGGGSCTFIAFGKNRCEDFAINSLFLSTYCSSFLAGTYSANSCATQNASKTLIGRCTKGVGKAPYYGNGMVTHHFYDTSTLTDVDFECPSYAGIQF